MNGWPRHFGSGAGPSWSTITFVDSERQWFKASSQCALTETPRSVSFCSVSMLQDEPLIVEDCTSRPRAFATALWSPGNPLCGFMPGFRSFRKRDSGWAASVSSNTEPRTLRMDELRLIRLGRDWVHAELEIRRMTRSAEDGFIACDERFHVRKRHYARLEGIAWRAVEEAFACLDRPFGLA